MLWFEEQISLTFADSAVVVAVPPLRIDMVSLLDLCGHLLLIFGSTVEIVYLTMLPLFIVDTHLLLCTYV